MECVQHRKDGVCAAAQNIWVVAHNRQVHMNVQVACLKVI